MGPIYSCLLGGNWTPEDTLGHKNCEAVCRWDRVSLGGNEYPGPGVWVGPSKGARGLGRAQAES